MKNRKFIAQEFANTIKSDKISQIILFGSVARGDDTEESDIDILIISKNPNDIELEIHSEVVNFAINTNELISPQIVAKKIMIKIKILDFLVMF